MDKRSVPGAVLGIIGTVFALIGGLNIAFCATVVGGSAEAVTGNGIGASYMIIAYLLGFGGALMGLIGGILDFKKPVAGGILQFIAIVMLIVVCAVVYFSFWEVIAMVLFLIGGILSFAVKKPISKD